MIDYILFLVIFKIISAPTWCFVLCWVGLVAHCIKFIINVYKFGKEKGEQNGK